MLGNPYQKITYSLNNSLAVKQRLFPYQPTSVNRGYIDGVLDEEGKLISFTSACSPLVFMGLQHQKDAQNIFVCAPEANLVRRYQLKEANNKTLAYPAHENSEFLVSKDESFRPINLYNAPDGSMYLLDLRKGIIQHRAYMTSYLREQILEKRLDSIHGKGRIYRIIEKGLEQRSAVPYRNLKEKEWIELLGSDLFYERIMAQKHLVYKLDFQDTSSIQALALNSQHPYAQLHALWTLEGKHALSKEFWIQTAQQNNETMVQVALMGLANLLFEGDTSLISVIDKYDQADNFDLDRQLILFLGPLNSEKAKSLLMDLTKKYRNDPMMCEAFISAIAGKETEWMDLLKAFGDRDSLSSFLEMAMDHKDKNEVQSPQLVNKFFKDKRTAGMDLYQVHCASCHAMDGKGKEKLAPPLVNSEYVSGSKDKLILLVLNGLMGPVTVNGKRYEMEAVMPGLKDNPNLTDKDIADLLIFLRNSFSFADTDIDRKRVAAWRNYSQKRKRMFTEEELNDPNLLKAE